METSLAFVLAGGKGDRLAPLTDDRAKPAVPFSRYRIIDHNASSLLNAGVNTVLFLPQYEPRSLDLHINRAYSHFKGERDIRMVYPREERRSDGHTEFAWYKGTAHAVKQNLEEITVYNNNPDHIMIFSGDHICALDVAEMLQQHHRQKRDLTIAVEVRKLSDDDFEVSKTDGELRYKYGIVDVDENDRIRGFREKPLRSEMGEPGSTVFVSMGNYIFDTDPLVGSLKDVTEQLNDFGKHVIPGMLEKNMDLFIYRFTGYWRDVGDVVSYYKACMDLNQENPPLDYKRLRELKRPVITVGGDIAPSRIIGEGRISTIAEGCELYSHVNNCVLGQNVYIGKDCIVSDSVLFPGVVVEEGVRIHNAIIDKNNVIPSGISLGYYGSSVDMLKTVQPNPHDSREKLYTLVKKNGDYITVVPRVNPKR